MAQIGSVEIPVELQTDGFDAQIAETEDKLNDLLATYEILKEQNGFDEQSNEARQLRSEIEKTQGKLEGLIGKQAKLKESGVSSFEGIGASLERFGKKVARVGITLLGARGIFGALSRATRTYLSANEDTANKINSIWMALGNLIGPIIEKIANWILKLVGYLNVFVKTVSRGKIDLTKNMGKNTKAIKGTSGAMKELNKQLAQFDEATVLQDQKLDSGGSGGGGLDSSFEMPALDEGWVAKIQNFGNWVLENWPAIKNGLIAIGLAIAGIKLSGFIGGLGSLIGGGAGATGGLLGGLGASLTGVGGAAAILGTALAGIGVTTAIVVAQNGAITKTSKEAREEFENMAKVGETVTKNQEKYNKMLKDGNTTEEQRTKILKNNVSRIQGTAKATYSYSDSLKECNGFLYKFGSWLHDDNTAMEINEGLIDKNNTTTKQYAVELKNLNKEGALTREEKEAYIRVLQQEYEDLSKTKRNLDENSAAYHNTRATMKLLRGTIDELSEGTDFYRDKMGSLKNKSEETGDVLGKVFDDVNSKLNTYNKTPIADKAAKVLIDADTSKANSSLSNLVTNLGNSIQNAFKKLDLKNILRQQINAFPSAVVSSLKNVFGLARGGIINMPGPGVPLASNVVGGERAPEGVIPLSDSQMMETLGEAIGRYITINASITNTMNGRVISRELQKISNESDFGSNR